MTNWHNLVIVIISVWTTKAYMWAKTHFAMPYKWTCPLCEKKQGAFRVSATDSESIEKLKLAHQRVHFEVNG
jgi:hypothetical protein